MSQTQLPATSSIGLNIKIGKKIPIMHIISNLGLALKILENKRAIMKCVSGKIHHNYKGKQERQY